MVADKITLNRIKTLHPKIRQEVLDAYMYINNKLLGKGVRLRFSHTTRTFEEQDNLYALGRTKKGKKVTNAKGGQSIHNYSLAFDIVILYDKDKNGTFETASWDTRYDGDRDGISDWLEVTRYFESLGYQNGFIRNGKKWDKPHFQKTFGHNWRSLKNKIDNGEYIEETVNGVTYKYANI